MPWKPWVTYASGLLPGVLVGGLWGRWRTSGRASEFQKGGRTQEARTKSGSRTPNPEADDKKRFTVDNDLDRSSYSSSFLLK